VARGGVVQVGDRAQAHAQPLARQFHGAAHRIALRGGQRHGVRGGQHAEVGGGGAQDQVLLGGEHRVLRLAHHGLGLRVALDHILAEQGLGHRQRLAVGRELGEAGAENRVVAAQDPLAAVDVLHVEAHRGQEACARLVDGGAAGAGFEHGGAVFRVAFARQLVRVEQRLGVTRRCDEHGQNNGASGYRPSHSPTPKHAAFIRTFVRRTILPQEPRVALPNVTQKIRESAVQKHVSRQVVRGLLRPIYNFISP
jgi:hypothetical protein